MRIRPLIRLRECHPPLSGQGGFTLLEIIIVVALFAFVYSVAMPRFNLKSGAESATRLGQVASDVRSAFDFALLSGKTYRMVFNVFTGDYWLEVADRNEIHLITDKTGRDPTEEEEQQAIEDFERRFEDYEVSAGEDYRDPDDDDGQIKATSPVVEAKKVLVPAKWTMVTNQEWSKRTLGQFLMIRDFQAEHHAQKQTLEALFDLGPKARVMLYFFPDGYVERAVLHIGFKKGDNEIDETQPQYTVTTDSNAGTASVKAGYEEVDVHEDSKTPL